MSKYKIYKQDIQIGDEEKGGEGVATKSAPHRFLKDLKLAK